MINNAIRTATAKPLLPEGQYAEANSVGYTPERREVDAPTETVAGQLKGLLTPGSAYLSTEDNQRAKATADQEMNSRGLINSSIAMGARRGAEIDRALQIATPDAAAYGTAKRDNQLAGNTASQFGADAKNRASLSNASEQNQFAKMDKQGKIERGLQTLRGDQESGLQTLRGTQAANVAQIQAASQKETAKIEGSYNQLIKTNESAGALYQQTTDAMNKILTNPDMDAATKQSAINKQLQLLKGGLNVMGKLSGLDLTSLLNFTGAGDASLSAPSPTRSMRALPVTPFGMIARLATRPTYNYSG